MPIPLMPKATAVWLLENTTLTFDQIADFCDFHVLEVQALADGEFSIVGIDPIATEQLTWEEIEKASQDPTYRMALKQSVAPKDRRTTGPKYTPLNKRQDKPDAVSWLLKQHPELTDNQIIKLVGTTKTTIDKIRHRSHWNMSNLKPRSPVDLGICKQKDLDAILNRIKDKEEAAQKSLERKARMQEKKKAKPVAKKEKVAKKVAPKKESAKKESVKKAPTKKKAPSKAAPKKKVTKSKKA
jgi:hypothetical protein